MVGINQRDLLVMEVLVRIIMLVFGYQLVLLTYGALLGQWAFFWKYEKLLLQKLGIMQSEKTKNSFKTVNIAIFASGAGSNAANIIRYLKNRLDTKIRINCVQ
jgi:hypothetical protein